VKYGAVTGASVSAFSSSVKASYSANFSSFSSSVSLTHSAYFSL